MSKCVCGKNATVAVVVHWADGDRIYRYCPSCALDVCALDGAEPAEIEGAGRG